MGRMAVLIDPPRWPAWGTVFSHLVSDSSLEELHAFARANGVSMRAFDHDHYDVPERDYDALVSAGAQPLRETELIRRLIAGGMRVRASERTPKREIAARDLHRSWQTLLPGHERLRDDLLARWSAPSRHYHDVRHLAVVVASLRQLGCDDRIVHLAAWFHDAVYDGVAGQDEESSARLARQSLDDVLSASEVAEVVRLVELTATHVPDAGDVPGASLCDADLAVLGANPGRYDVYARDVRLDYGHLEEEAFRLGRTAVLRDLLERPELFHTERGRELWQEQARRNLTRELASFDLP